MRTFMIIKDQLGAKTQREKFNGQNLFGPRTNTDHNQ